MVSACCIQLPKKAHKEQLKNNRFLKLALKKFFIISIRFKCVKCRPELFTSSQDALRCEKIDFSVLFAFRVNRRSVLLNSAAASDRVLEK